MGAEGLERSPGDHLLEKFALWLVLAMAMNMAITKPNQGMAYKACWFKETL